VTVGDRYPAAGRENVLQMFTARFADDPDPRIRELARLGAAGKITAVQLELAVPLRWPGPLRATLFEAMQTFAEVGTPTDGHPSLTGFDAPIAQTTAAERLAVEFHEIGRAHV